MSEVAPAPAAPAAPVTSGAPPVAPKAAAKPVAAPPEEFWEYTGEGGETVKIAKTEAQKRLGKSGYADKIIKQGAEALKAAKAEREALAKEREEEKRLAKENRREFLKKYGIDEEESAREVLERKLREHEMSPAERQAAEYKAKLDEHEKQAAERTKKEEAATVEKQAAHLQTLMIAELQKACVAAGWGENVDGERFAVIQSLVQQSFDADMPVDGQWATRIVEAAKEQLDASHQRLEKAVLGGLKGQALVDRLGPAIVKEVLAHEVERIRGKRAAPAARATPAPKAEADPYLTEAQFREQMRNLGGKR